jgi:hypothetical protein
MTNTYHKIVDLIYKPYATTYEIIHNDRILYISTFDKENSTSSDCIIDISYGLFEWMNLNIQEFIRDVQQTSYRVIGNANLQTYLKKTYDIDLPSVPEIPLVI